MKFHRTGAAAALILLAACSQEAEEKGGGRGGARGPTTVGFVVVRPVSVADTIELAGRTAAFQMSEVRPQVTGLILRRLFTEGSAVRAGQPLYQIDNRLYRASANQAAANLASAQATAEAARIRSDRFRPLAQMEAVSKQDFTDALATSRQATASVAQNRAALDTARINLRFATITAPISGRIGRSLFTVGALVSSTQADPLAVIQRLDPMFVDIQQSSADLLRLRRLLAGGQSAAGSATVRLKLEDGSDYGATGQVEFAEAMVDPATGTVTLRARFPNPQGLLLPGMFVRATFAPTTDQTAFLVPQQAVSRDPRGNATLFVVGPNDKAAQRTVRAERTQGRFWVVTDGLRAGDRVITQGLARVKPNAAIRPVPAGQAQRVVAPAEGDQPGNSSSKGG